MSFDVTFSYDGEFTANMDSYCAYTMAYGKKLLVDGVNLSLVDQNDKILSTVQTQDTTYGLANTTDSGLMSNVDWLKLDGIETGAQKNVQANWAQLNINADDYIKSKPTGLSQFANDSGFITSETDPVFSASVASIITSTDIINWNNKSEFSGNYSDLIGNPTNLSEFTDDLGTSPMHTHAQYITTETDPTVPSWAKQENKPTYSVAEISDAQSIVDNSLTTTDKTIVGAINEINSTVGTLNNELELALGGGV